ncbi:hypothetical protein [Actinoplanes sp. RD1]|uniref:hypothetical protein n=1 Tax=Actinoplanes sp. RD1 TaxID=3064538 RepID=UPI0027423C40|nr:hypothetical protein [Actinoplanes sp. RD1]
MPDLTLSLAERALLLILLAENGELSNKQIEERYAPSLKLTGKSRLKLVDAKLIECRKEKNSFHFSLAENGWYWGREELTREVPRGSGSAGQALYAVLRRLGHYLYRTGHSLAQVLGDQPGDDRREPENSRAEAGQGAAPAIPAARARPAADEIDKRVRRAYRELAEPAGGWIGLADLRDRLPDLTRAELDGVLRLLARMPGVLVEEETNQKGLTTRDRDAAVVIGNRDHHVLMIEDM